MASFCYLDPSSRDSVLRFPWNTNKSLRTCLLPYSHSLPVGGVVAWHRLPQFIRNTFPWRDNYKVHLEATHWVWGISIHPSLRTRLISIHLNLGGFLWVLGQSTQSSNRLDLNSDELDHLDVVSWKSAVLHYRAVFWRKYIPFHYPHKLGMQTQEDVLVHKSVMFASHQWGWGSVTKILWPVLDHPHRSYVPIFPKFYSFFKIKFLRLEYISVNQGSKFFKQTCT